MLRETLSSLGLLASIAACSGQNTAAKEPASTAAGNSASAHADGEPSAAPEASTRGALPEPPTALDAQTIVGRRYWADPQRAGWTYDVDLCLNERAIERNTGKVSEGRYELRGTELVIQFNDRVARFQFPSGPDFMVGTSKLGRPQRLEHKGESDCTK